MRGRDSELKASIQRGIQAGAAELNARLEEKQPVEESNAAALKAAFNAAGGITAGLKTLRRKRHSKIKFFKPYQYYNDVHISTNIPVYSAETNVTVKGIRRAMLSITVTGDGKITAYGDDQKGPEGHARETVSTENGDVKPILEFVAQKAARSGLIR